MVPAVVMGAQGNLYGSRRVWITLFQDGQGLEGKEKRRHSGQKDEGRPKWDKWKRLHLSCSLIDPTHSRGLLGISEYVKI